MFEVLNEDEDDEEHIADGDGSATAESREPSESLLTRCEPKPSKDSNKQDEWTPASKMKKRLKKKEAKARKKAR